MSGCGFLCVLAPIAGVVVAAVAPELPELTNRSSTAKPESDAPAMLQSGEARVQSLAWTPDGMTLASGNLDGRVTLWNVGEERPRTVLPESVARSLSEEWLGLFPLAWSPDGTILASTRGHEVILRDASDGRARATFRVAAPPVQSLTFSPDGAALAAGCVDGTVAFWDMAAGRVRAVWRGHPGSVNGLAFAPDGRTIASASIEGTLCVRDAATGRLESSAKAAWGIRSLAFAPDGLAIATSGTYLTVWDAATARIRLVLDRDGGSWNSVAYSPDGRWLAAASQLRGNLTLWDTAGFRRRATLRGRVGPRYALAFAPDGRTLASAGQDGMIELWTLADVLGRGAPER